MRAEIDTLKNASVAHRASITDLSRQVITLEKELRRVVTESMRSATIDSGNETNTDKRLRFSASRLAAHRTKLGLSAADYGNLLGVSAQTIDHWKQR